MRDPFFIVYKARSGSTLLADMLSKHPEIGVAPESNFIPTIYSELTPENTKFTNHDELRALFQRLLQEKKFKAWGLTFQMLLNNLEGDFPYTGRMIASAIIHTYCRNRWPGCRVIGLKKGGWYTNNIWTLRQIFPGAKFIHIVRDGRAVYNSSKRSIYSKTGMGFETDVVQSAIRWRDTVESFRAVMKSDMHSNDAIFTEVKYESLVDDPGRVLADIYALLGVDVVSDCFRSKESRNSGPDFQAGIRQDYFTLIFRRH